MEHKIKMSENKENNIDITDERNSEVSLPMNEKLLAYGVQYACKPLPIDKYENELLRKLELHHTLILCGPTGSGKSTRIVQMIYDHCRARRKKCYIVVAEPRRIATMSLAHRVSTERGWKLGSTVGYQVALEKVAERNKTCILYCTTRILLQKIIEAKSLNEYTHIILDEIHERSQELDLLLVIIKRFLNSASQSTKVILMSATMNMKKFSEYFNFTYGGLEFPAVTLKIDADFKSRKGGCLPSLKIYYLDQIPAVDKPVMSFCKPQLHTMLFDVVVKLLRAFDALDKSDDGSGTRGSVLIFLPGIQEITMLYDVLKESIRTFSCSWWILVLHSSITKTEQMKVFTDMHQEELVGTRKIILSTNIAESSITVPEVKYVIDFCLTKESVYDMSSNHTTLKLNWASKMNAVQRAGRAGRVISGRVYRLVTQEFYDEFLTELQPQILRAPIDKLILDLKLLDMGKPKLILGSALDPPDLYNIGIAVSSLKEIGALLVTANGKMDPYDGDLTCLGKVIAKLPLNPRLGKLIVLGRMFNVLEEAKAIACALSVGDVFSSPFPKNLEAYSSRLRWAEGTQSDFMSLYKAYTKWQYLVSRGEITKKKDEEEYSKHSFVQIKALRGVFILEKDVDNRLLNLGIDLFATLQTPHEFDRETKKFFLEIAIAGAFYPNYFFGIPNEENEKIKEDMEKSGFNVQSTVYMTGMRTDQPGVMYSKYIKKYFTDIAETINIDFRDSYVYVELEPNTAESFNKIPDAVYNAIKLRSEKDIVIPFLRSDYAERYIEEYKESKFNDKNILAGRINGCYVGNRAQFKMTHCDEEGRFWVQRMDNKSQEILKNLHKDLNERLKSSLCYPASIQVGKSYVTMYHHTLRRCRVITDYNNDSFEVYYVDYGAKGVLSNTLLYELPKNGLSAHYEDMAIECRLYGIKIDRDYADQVQNYIIRAFSNKVISAEVYSHVENVMTLKIFLNDSNNEKTINNVLVEKGYAMVMEESYLSKKSHRMLLDGKIDDMPVPKEYKCKESVVLDGPYSPLEIDFLSSRLHSLVDKKIVINTNSINSVLLHDRPDRCYESMVVAASVSVNPRGNVNLRDTVVIPNINGLSCILSLLFSPILELKTNSRNTRYTGAIFGLGVDSNSGSSVFPSNDVSMEFDCRIGMDTIEKVNRIRRLMNDILVYFDDISNDNFVILQSKLITLVEGVLNERRLSSYLDGRHVWQSVQHVWSKDSMMCYVLSKKDDVYKEIYTPILFPELPNDPFIDCDNIKRNLEFLQSHSGDCRGPPPKKLSCLLCRVSLSDLEKMKIHLSSRVHQTALREFTKYCSE